MKASIPDHKLDTAIWKIAPAQHFAFSSDSSAAWAFHTNITRSTGSEAVAQPIIGFSIATYHFYDAEVGGPLKEPLKDTFEKEQNRFPAQIANRLSSLADLAPRFFAEQDYGIPCHYPYNHHVAPERVGS